MIEKDKYLNHIKDSEIKETINKFIDSLRSLRNEYITVVSDFMNPKELEYAEIVLKDFPEISYRIYGFMEPAERKAMLLGYKKDIPEEYFSILEITYHDRSIQHKDVLGAMLNLGMDRSKIGDIVVSNKIYVVAQKPMQDFLLFELKKIRHSKVEVRISDLKIMEKPEPEFESFHLVVSSCRLDVLVHSICHIPRTRAVQMIRAGFVKVNYEQIYSASFEVPIHALISVRRWGRFVFEDILQKTKKEKLLVQIKRMKKI